MIESILIGLVILGGLTLFAFVISYITEKRCHELYYEEGYEDGLREGYENGFEEAKSFI